MNLKKSLKNVFVEFISNCITIILSCFYEHPCSIKNSALIEFKTSKTFLQFFHFWVRISLHFFRWSTFRFVPVRTGLWNSALSKNMGGNLDQFNEIKEYSEVQFLNIFFRLAPLWIYKLMTHNLWVIYYEYFRTKVQSFCIAAYIVGTEVSTKFSGRSFSKPMASELFIAAPPRKIM